MGKPFKTIGMDTSIPHIGVIMEKLNPAEYPQIPLPEGFSFIRYSDELRDAWVQMQLEVEQIDSIEDGKSEFHECYVKHKPEIINTCVFVTACDGNVAGTALLCDGSLFGDVRKRVHWVTVAPAYQNRGLCGAMLTKLMDMYNERGFKKCIYLTSQTWSYKAIGIYEKFGFTPYMGEKPKNWCSANMTSGNFEPWNYKEKTLEAWKMIKNKLDEYKNSN